MINLSPCLLRGMSMSPQRSFSFQKAMFLVLSARRSSQEGQLSRDLLCVAEDERQNCLDHPMARPRSLEPELSSRFIPMNQKRSCSGCWKRPCGSVR
jgi:hypothetical protein